MRRDSVPALAGQRDALAQRFLRHGRPDVPAEQVVQPVAFVQPTDHLVHARLQQSDLAGIGHRHRHIEVAFAHGPHDLGQFAYRRADRLRSKRAGENTDSE